MSLRLRAMTEPEFDVWAVEHRGAYIRDLVDHGGADPEAAARKADRDKELFLARGLETPGHVFFVVEHEDEGPVGHLWLGEMDRGEGPVAFVFDVEIKPEHRGKGHGRGAMELAEEEARALGHRRLELNVFGGNEVGRNLYRSLGYQELAVSMGKKLE
jgi:GNAT superfamily N-acetyltransferase